MVGVDPIEIGVRVLLGKIDREGLERVHARSMSSLFEEKIGISAYFIADRPGKVSFNRDAYRRYRKTNTHYLSLSLDVEEGDRIVQTTTSYDRCGHYIISAGDLRTLCECEDRMLKDIGFAVC